MNRGLRRAVALSGLVLGCSHFQHIDKPTLGRGGDDRALPSGQKSPPSVPLTRKQVASKESPSTLVAIDGAKCLVSADRYDGVKVGDLVWCGWTATSSP